VLFYFHANAEDAGFVQKTVKYIADGLKCEFVIPEYPGYGLYKEGKEGEKQMQKSHRRCNESGAGRGDE